MTLRVQGCGHKWNCDWKKRGKDKGMVSVQTTVIRLHTSRLEQTLRSCFCRFSVVPHYWCCCKDARCFNHFIALQCVQIILFTSLCGVTYTTFLSFIAAHRSGFSPTSNEIFAPCLCRLFLGGFPHTRHYHQQQQQRSRSGICMFCLLCMFGCSLPAFGGCLVHFRGIVAYSATIFHVNRVMQKKTEFTIRCQMWQTPWKISPQCVYYAVLRPERSVRVYSSNVTQKYMEHGPKRCPLLYLHGVFPRFSSEIHNNAYNGSYTPSTSIQTNWSFVSPRRYFVFVCLWSGLHEWLYCVKDGSNQSQLPTTTASVAFCLSCISSFAALFPFFRNWKKNM